MREDCSITPFHLSERTSKLLEDGTRLYPVAMAICAAVLGLTAPQAPGAGVLGAAAAGALFVLDSAFLVLCVGAVLTTGLFLVPDAQTSTAYWLDLLIVLATAAIPRRFAPALLQASRWSWLAAMVSGSIALSLYFALPSPFEHAALALACICSAFIGAGITRHLAVVDARLLAWGDRGLAEVTRDLLLGRITSGMLHDLAQPLNVISMANANMDYIISHLEIDDENRRQLEERVKRIAGHTDGAAGILNLFRWFGRDGGDGDARLTVRSSLERALAATKSNVRHHGVTIRLQGDALDWPVPEQHGALEMIAVAALLSAFAGFISKHGEKLAGEVVLQAMTTPAHIVITVECTDENGQPLPSRRMDEATLWLVEQVARQASSQFRCLVRGSQPARFIIRLGRTDI